MAKLSMRTLMRLMLAYGVPRDQVPIAVSIAVAESGLSTVAHNPKPPDNSYGLFQINMIGKLGIDRRKRWGLKLDSQLFDPTTNVLAMIEISGGGRNWRPWSTYVNGAYKKSMPEAQRTLESMMAGRGTVDDVIAAALARAGEVEDPPNSNVSPTTEYMDSKYPPVPLASGGTSTRGHTSWCGTFTLCAMDEGGARVEPSGCIIVNGQVVWDFYTPQDVQRWKAANRWLDYTETPPPGALIYYDWEGTHGTRSLTDHVGLVIDVDANGVISTVEGNTSPTGLSSNGGMVCTFGPGMMAAARPKSSIVGYGLPYYNTPVPGDDTMGILKMVKFSNDPTAVFIAEWYQPGVMRYVEHISPGLWENYHNLLGYPDFDSVELFDQSVLGNVTCIGPCPPSWNPALFFRVIDPKPGPAGADGRPGINGRDGINGAPGTPGTNGVSPDPNVVANAAVTIIKSRL